jgi:hypothetical protein
MGLISVGIIKSKYISERDKLPKMSENKAKYARLHSATQSRTFPIFIFGSHTELTSVGLGSSYSSVSTQYYCYVCTLWKMQLNELLDCTEADIPLLGCISPLPKA